jgi:predicted NUDIX family NTP pyrophosphohydrolase
MTQKSPKISAGILLYRFKNDVLEVLIVHPGGPFYAKKDLGVWDMPKGEMESGEELFAASLREFEEEIGINLAQVEKSEFKELGSLKNSSGKTVHIWALQGDLPLDFVLKSNQIEIIWPPRSEQKITIPEVDQARFTPIHIAKTKVWTYQVEFLNRLEKLLDYKNEAKDESILF